jgi:hypothetical protein
MNLISIPGVIAVGCFGGSLIALFVVVCNSFRLKTVKGVVKEIKTEDHTQAHDDQLHFYRFPVIQYRPNPESELLEFKDNNGAFSERLSPGDVVDILFYPKNPNALVLNHGFRRYRVALFLFFVGSLALLPLIIK